VSYLRHHLREAGSRAGLAITEEAMQLLADACGGVPRLLNRTALLAFHMADAASVDEVDVEVVLEALNQLELSVPVPIEGDPALLPLVRPSGKPVPKRASAKKSKRTSA